MPGPTGPTQPIIYVAGLPVALVYDASGFYATAEYQNVYINGSPLIVDLVPPVADVSQVNAPALLLALLGALASGAIIQP